MALTLIGGTRSMNSLESNREDVDYMHGILTLETWKTPITAMTSRYQTYSSQTQEVNKYQDELVPMADQINDVGGMIDSDDTMTPDNPELFPIGTLIKVDRTGEVVYVTANDGTDLTIVREYGVGEGWSSTAAAIVDNDYLSIVSRVYNQGHAMPTIVSTQPVLTKNYAADFRSPFGMTEILLDSALRGTPDWDHQETKGATQHAMLLEMNNVDGKPYAGNKKEYVENSSSVDGTMTAGGIDHFLVEAGNADNLVDQDELTKFEFMSFCETLFDKGSSEKYMYAPDSFFYQGLDVWGMTTLNTYTGEDMLGMRIGRWEFSAGKTLYFVNHDGLKSKDPGTLYHRAYALDLKNLFHVIFGRNGSTRLRDKIKYDNSDGKTIEKQEYQTTQCILPLQMKTHARLRYKTIAA